MTKNQQKKIKRKKPDSQPKSKECSDNLPLTILLIIGGTGGTFAGIGKLLATLRDLIGDPKMDLTQYLESPDYKKQVAFIEKFHNDFSKIVNAYAGKNEKVYVFIDDLDRCELGKSADLLQALNLMISNDPNIIFILGMDREKVAAAITFRQKEVLPYLASILENNQESKTEKHELRKKLDYGFSFMEKFIQLSFTVPQPSENTLDNFLDKTAVNNEENQKEKSFFWTPFSSFLNQIVNLIKLKLIIGKQLIDNPKIIVACSMLLIESKLYRLTSLLLQDYPKKNTQINKTPDLAIFPIIEKDLTPESLDDVVKMVAPFFDYNPRRLKQYINVLRLRTYIAYYAVGVPFAEKEKIKITREQIGKFIAITLKYPRLLFELQKNDKLLAKLENLALNQSFQLNSSIILLNHKSSPNNEEKGNANYWINNYPQLGTLLCHGRDKTSELPKTYSLNNESIKKLLTISSQGIPSQFLRLREFLANEQWQEADQETGKLMIQLGDKNNKGFLSTEDCQNFPREELRIIDQLWVKYSEGKFGFSVQKQIYLDKCNGKLDSPDLEAEAYLKMADIVGWREKEKWLFYSSLTFNTTAKLGHLPKGLRGGFHLFSSLDSNT